MTGCEEGFGSLIVYSLNPQEMTILKGGFLWREQKLEK